VQRLKDLSDNIAEIRTAGDQVADGLSFIAHAEKLSIRRTEFDGRVAQFPAG
jgi:hypothetical protein